MKGCLVHMPEQYTDADHNHSTLTVIVYLTLASEVHDPCNVRRVEHFAVKGSTRSQSSLPCSIQVVSEHLVALVAEALSTYLLPL